MFLDRKVVQQTERLHQSAAEQPERCREKEKPAAGAGLRIVRFAAGPAYSPSQGRTAVRQWVVQFSAQMPKEGQSGHLR